MPVAAVPGSISGAICMAKALPDPASHSSPPVPTSQKRFEKVLDFISSSLGKLDVQTQYLLRARPCGRGIFHRGLTPARSAAAIALGEHPRGTISAIALEADPLSEIRYR